jgi:CheY-like chemotaxis protein
MKILIVDDDDFVRMLTRVSLSKVGGMQVIEARNGAEGLIAATEHLPDVIMLDVMMPVMDGPATFAALKANTLTANIPVVFLTAKSTPAEQADIKALGGAAIFTKPFDPLSLADDVRRVLSEPR